jgi:pyridinium-3,5-bisthiocarboxylic acid mononucleotide nickel chelatase
VRLAYLDCFSGISGDMALGAFVHAGADLDRIFQSLESLPIDGFLLEREEIEDHGIVATRIHVKTRPQGVIRTYASIRQLIQESALPPGARRTAGRIFQRLAEGMAKVHGKEPEVVTFHELGEIDVIAEVIGVSLSLDMLGVERVFASPIPTGMGMTHHEHGLTPIPSPEVVELLQAVPTYTRGIPVELVSQVGAAIVATVVEGFGDMPIMRSERVGYGAGHPRLDFPNLLRVVIGEEEPAWRRATAPPPEALDLDDGVAWPQSSAAERLAVVPAGEPEEVELDCLVPDPGDEDRAALIESLYDAGATEAWAATVLTRGGAAGLRLHAICPSQAEDAVAGAMTNAGAETIHAATIQRHRP